MSWGKTIPVRCPVCGFPERYPVGTGYGWPCPDCEANAHEEDFDEEKGLS
ncbi:MAG: hypothetical protein ACYDAD_07935 [Acidimicrobiales bacterium]